MIEGMRFPLVTNMTMAESLELEGTRTVMSDEEFRSFYERTARPLWSYLSRITGNAQLADDFLQEAYYRLYRRGNCYEDESHRRNSLFQIATNLARDAARHGRRYESVPLETEDSPSLLKSEAPAPERQASIRTDLGRAMQQLEPVQREMLWLAYAQGASHQEIADVLGLRAISVRTLLLRARRKLAGILDGGSARSRTQAVQR